MPKKRDILDCMKVARKGYKFMNKAMPGWQNKVNIELLNMSNSRNCIIGQTLGDYDQVSRLGISEEDAPKYGLEVFDDDLTYAMSRDEYSLLTECWLFLITHDQTWEAE